jgi:hypothetical protein
MVVHRPLALCAAAAVLFLLASLAATPAAWAVQPGAVSAITWGQSRADVDREVELLRANGARYVRANINWAGLEPDRKGVFDAGALANYDYAIDKVLAAGMQVVMPISDGVPYWASADPDKHIDASGTRRWDHFYPPADFADYGDVVRRVAAHYAPRGVHVYEIWNEPNLVYFWSAGPDPAEYVKMLKAGYGAIKQADPASTVLLGGLSKNDFEYLEGVYRAGGGGHFDAVAVHPYTYGVDPTVSWNGVNAGEDPSRISKNAFPAIKEIRRTMEAFGDASKKVWITEFGYSTTSQDGGVSQSTQAAFLTKAYTYAQQFPWVEAMLWYSARNNPWTADRDDYGSQFGLVSAKWTPMASLSAFKSFASTVAPAPAPAPDPAPTAVATPVATPPPASSPVNRPPSIDLTSPVQGATFVSSLTLAAAATDDVAVERVEFRVDGKLVFTDRSAPYQTTWTPGRNIKLGDHQVSARAYDAQGLAATATVTVRRVAKASATFTRVIAPRVSTTSRSRVLVRGRVPRRLRGDGARVHVEVQRRGRATRRWQTRARKRAAVHRGRYRAAVRARSGRWRVRVVVDGGAGDRAVGARIVRFSA